MSNPPTTSRRLAVAITAAVASTTLAVGVTAASLMGWFGPTAGAPTSSASIEPAGSQPMILVPIAPATPPGSPRPQLDTSDADLQLAMDERPRHHDDDERNHDERREHDNRDEGDDE